MKMRHERAIQGKETIIYLRGKRVDMNDAIRHLKRSNLTVEAALSIASSASSPDIRCVTPTTPPLMRVAEQLYVAIDQYMSSRFKDDGASPLNTWSPVVGSFYSSKKLLEFNTGISFAIDLWAEGEMAKAERQLIYSFAQMPGVLQEQAPALLHYIFYFLRKAESRQMVYFKYRLVQHFKQLAEILLPPNHQLITVFRSLEALVSAFGNIGSNPMKCFKEKADALFGAEDIVTVQSTLDYYREVENDNNHNRIEPFLRQITSERQSSLGLADPIALVTFRWWSFSLCQLGRLPEAELACLQLFENLQLDETDDFAFMTWVDLMQDLCFCQFNQSKKAAAERTLRTLIDQLRRRFGNRHARTLYCSHNLWKDFLIPSGRTAEASELTFKIDAIYEGTYIP